MRRKLMPDDYVAAFLLVKLITDPPKCFYCVRPRDDVISSQRDLNDFFLNAWWDWLTMLLQTA